ncbi:hypothetical protein LCGC14_1138390 [marine sediment metagenome]|uniref:Uncharacterized protein n=1 Tax=marine sediment metagenome TaxID=412755 RepID=A0A0F9PH82_9ZZZZ
MSQHLQNCPFSLHHPDTTDPLIDNVVESADPLELGQTQ